MAYGDAELLAAKNSYRSAKELGSREEEARWANMVGDILKNRGEYVEALRWLRIDYEVSIKYLPEKQVLPTCQSLGEVYLRLQEFKNALIYQKKHLELAKDSDDLVEQQRASTQLGRTYHEMFLRSEDDHYSVRNAKKYFKSAMRLAQSLKENPPSNKSYLKEYIDAHNNLGMLEMDLDNFEEAKKILTEGLRICDEEEVTEDNDGRSRLHHNLGNVFMELRMWDEARKHIEKDILICKNIGHCQGEAKGFINLGELHYRVQRYEDAIQCYEKALNLANSMEDEHALANQINQNIKTVREAIKVLADLRQEEQNLKKLTRKMVSAKGTAGERKCLLQQNSCLDHLIEKSSVIFAWLKHREFAKKKKKIAHQLCDKEKLGDSFLAIGESYQKLRNFNKALKWYKKSWESYKAIGNMEGQALAKINIGDALDSDGQWSEAFDAFEEGYRIALGAKLPFVQLSALENMHYSHMIRFDNVEEARRLQDKIDDLKQSSNKGLAVDMAEDCCSETDTEGEDIVSYSRSDTRCSERETYANNLGFKPPTRVDELNEDAPLVSLLQSCKAKRQSAHVEFTKTCPKRPEDSPIGLTESNENQQTVSVRKRLRVVLSDDEDEVQDEIGCSGVQLRRSSAKCIATSDEIKNQTNSHCPAGIFQDNSAVGFNFANDSSNPVNLEESTCSLRSRNSTGRGSQNGKEFRSSSSNGPFFTSNIATSSSRCDIKLSGDLLQRNNVDNLSLQTSTDGYGLQQSVPFRINHGVVHIDIDSLLVGDDFSIASMKVQVACLYYLQLSSERRSNGLLPIIHEMRLNGRMLEQNEIRDTCMDSVGKGCIEIIVGGWVQKRLIKLYVDCCDKRCEAPNIKLLKKLYTLEVEDEIVVSDCELQDISVLPLLDALKALNSVAVLDLSHNLLGNGTMEKLNQVFTSLGQTYGDLSLDLHCNRFGSTALFQICECPALLTRLVVLNISGNRLTDACGSYLTTILKSCKALYSLNVERCSVTSRTIQKIADALDSESALSQLCAGYNNPITGNAISTLLSKLSVVKRFSELNLNGLKLGKSVIENLCRLVKVSSLSVLMLGETGIGTDGAMQLTETLSSSTQELVKLDLSYCGLTFDYMSKLSTYINLTSCVQELRIGGNPIMQEGGDAVASLLRNPHCSLKVLILSNCKLGLDGILHIVQALAENNSLEEVNLAENNIHAQKNFLNDLKEREILEELQPVKEISPVRQCSSVMSADCSQLEVADSEDCAMSKEPAVPGFDDSCASSSQRNNSDECLYIQDLSAAIIMAKTLQLLDLSANGLSIQAVEALWSAWSSCSRNGVARRHVRSQMIHFLVDGKECCRLKPCCRND